MSRPSINCSESVSAGDPGVPGPRLPDSRDHYGEASDRVTRSTHRPVEAKPQSGSLGPAIITLFRRVKRPLTTEAAGRLDWVSGTAQALATAAV
jgi:hypothetical protein